MFLVIFLCLFFYSGLLGFYSFIVCLLPKLREKEEKVASVRIVGQ